MRSNYAEEATKVAQRQYSSLLEVLRAVGQVKGWQTQQIVFVGPIQFHPVFAARISLGTDLLALTTPPVPPSTGFSSPPLSLLPTIHPSSKTAHTVLGPIVYESHSIIMITKVSVVVWSHLLEYDE